MPEFNRPKGRTRYNYLSTNKQPIPSLEIDADFNYLKDMVNSAQASIQNFSDWIAAGTPTYIAGNQFSVSGDHTADFVVDRGFKGTLAPSTTVYSWVQAVSYGAGITTVTLTTSVLTSALSAVWFGLISAGNNVLPSNLATATAAAAAEATHAASATAADDAAKVGGFTPSQTPGVNKVVATSKNLLSANQASVETDTTGFNAVGDATISRDTTEHYDGAASLKCVTTGAGVEGGATGLIAVNPSQTYWASLWVKGSGTIAMQVGEYDAGFADVGYSGSGSIVLSSSWQRVSVLRQFSAAGVWARIFFTTDTPQAITFFCDALQWEDGSLTDFKLPFTDIKPWLKKITGVAWIAHGDNVINFPSSLRDGYIVFPQIIQNLTRNKKNPLPYKFGVEWKREGLSQIKVNVKGGYGVTSCGNGPSGTTERFDDAGNAHTGRTAATTARDGSSGYSLNGYGFTSGGHIAAASAIVERFDDVANTHTSRTGLTTARYNLAGYSLNGYGFSSGGYTTTYVGVTERFDDVGNAHTGRTGLTTARYGLAGYSLNGYGFTSCGFIAAASGVVERFDDAGNSHVGRLDATVRNYPAGYSFNGYGFTSCGVTNGTTERFDDVGNSHTARTSASTRFGPAGYSLNGYGFTSCGYNAGVQSTVERFDDVANNHIARTAATARYQLTGYALNEFFISYIAMNVS